MSNPIQELAGIITVAGVLAVALAFAFVAINSAAKSDYQPIQKKASRARSLTFWGLLIIIVPVTVYTLGKLPYPNYVSDKKNAKTVQVTAYQWRWEISDTAAIVNQPVAYHVTSADVNHGFALYDPDLHIVAQTQAMPGYTNVLYHTFDEPGTYKVLCLEYCGLLHHGMIAEIQVTEGGGQ